MNLRQLKWYEAIAMVLLGMAVGATCVAYILDWPGWLAAVSGQTWAAWLQAFGAVAAIWAGFALAGRQYAVGLRLQRSQERREEARRDWADRLEVSRILLAIEDELDIRVEQFLRVIGDDLDACERQGKGFFPAYNVMPSEPFPVYRSLVARLPLVRSQDLRQRIVRTYAQLEGLVLTVQTNSELARTYLDADAEAKASAPIDRKERRAIAEGKLRDYFPTLVRTREEVIAQANALVDSIRWSDERNAVPTSRRA
ncbi:hypothetical protein [Achromobacter deleyi]|uniref:hypothetical protein n=1 Tax=Achromobacter deleyi TaxID=1353891 RepID=UPI001490E17A|nr:hypothetical protein [Achromobacter deleyi]QVQ29318.1 hypothetical protein HLG70_13355 [Achromobacter deleyi]UIP19439.1 hypothetical protein LYZ39_20965 [Achromobacter deleyi]